MNDQFEQALAQIAEEKGVSREEIISMIEASLAAAFRKDYGEKDQNPVVVFNGENLSAKIYDEKTVVTGKTLESEDPETLLDPVKEIDIEVAKLEKPDAKTGDVIRKEITPADGVEFGRIAAQTAKRVIIQKLREAEIGRAHV